MGLSAAFAADPVILGMAVVLDFCKIIAVSTLAKKWKKLSAAIKVYLICATIVLMTITSSGVAGYLSNSFQKAMLPNQGNSIQLDALTKEQTTLQARKEEIDKQVAAVPPNLVKSRRQLIATFKPEEDKINARLDEITKQIPTLQTTQVKQNTEVGPVMFLADAFKITPASAVSMVIAMIVFVFDPLSIMFMVTGNNLLNYRDEEKKEQRIADLEAVEAVEDMRDQEIAALREKHGEALEKLDALPNEVYACKRCSKTINAGEAISCADGPCPMELIDADTHQEIHEARVAQGAIKPEHHDEEPTIYEPPMQFDPVTWNPIQHMPLDYHKILGDPRESVTVTSNPNVIYMNPRQQVPVERKSRKPKVEEYVFHTPTHEGPASKALNELEEYNEHLNAHADRIDRGVQVPEVVEDPVVPEPVVEETPIEQPAWPFPTFEKQGPWPWPKNPDGVIFEPVNWEDERSKDIYEAFKDAEAPEVQGDLKPTYVDPHAIVVDGPKLEEWDTVSIPSDMLDEVKVEEATVPPTQQEQLDEVLREILSDNPNGTLTDEERKRLDKALDKIFGPQEGAPDEVEVVAQPIQAETTLDDPTLLTTPGSGVEFIGEHWINPGLLDIYGNKK